jgi:hypothetical protein
VISLNPKNSNKPERAHRVWKMIRKLHWLVRCCLLRHRCSVKVNEPLVLAGLSLFVVLFVVCLFSFLPVSLCILLIVFIVFLFFFFLSTESRRCVLHSLSYSPLQSVSNPLLHNITYKTLKRFVPSFVHSFVRSFVRFVRSFVLVCSCVLISRLFSFCFCSLFVLVSFFLFVRSLKFSRLWL